MEKHGGEKRISIGVIGGSGLYQMDTMKVVKEHEVKTPFGMPSSTVAEVELKSGERFYFLPRHGTGHTILPSEINYRANIFALKKMGVRHLVSVSAVGSLKEELDPGMFSLPSQFIDWTKGFRKRTFFGDGLVGHVSTALPVEKGLQDLIASVCRETSVPCSEGGTYICIEGPQFSSKAESQIYRSFGASIIGMTNVPEAYLAKEAGMAYATIGMVTDYDCWKDHHCSLEEIMNVMKTNNVSAKKVVEVLVRELTQRPPAFEPENQFAVVTSKEKWQKSHEEIVNVLLAR